jgi:polyisoprenoid-binding protein YceI
MTSLIRNTFLASALVLASAGAARAGEWQLDPAHSAAHFAVRHMMVSTVRGEFQKVSGTVKLDDKDLTKSAIDVTIDVTTINTREPKRDAHLKSPDFFDVEKFPTMTFKSTKIEKAGKGKYKVTGDLTMHGQTHPVTLVVDDLTPATKNPWGMNVRGVSASGKLSRKEWGLNWNKALEAGGVLVSDEVQLTIDAEMQEQPAQKAAN